MSFAVCNVFQPESMHYQRKSFKSNMDLLFPAKPSERPTLTMSLTDVLNIGDSVTFTCSVTLTSQPAEYREEPVYSWYNRDNLIQGETGASYVIYNVTKEMINDRFTCRGKDDGAPDNSKSEPSNEITLEPIRE